MKKDEMQMDTELLKALLLPVDANFAYDPRSGWDLGGGISWPMGRLLVHSVVRGLQTSTEDLLDAHTHTQSATTFNQYKEMITNVTHATGSGFGASASATVKYLSEKEFNELTIFLVTGHTIIKAIERQPYDKWDDLVLSDEALTVLQRSAKEFIEAYGTHFISGFIRGGGFLGCVNIRARSQSEKTQIEAEMKASINAFGAQGDIANTYKRDVSQLKVECHKVADSIEQGAMSQTYPAADITKMIEARDNHWKELRDAKTTPRMVALCTQYRALKQVQSLREGQLLHKDRETGRWTVTQLTKDEIPADIELLWQESTDEVIDLLFGEYEALKYMKSTTSTVLANKQYIGPSRKQTLEDINKIAITGLDTFQNLPFEKFSELTPQKIWKSGLLVSKQWLPKLELATDTNKLTLEWTIWVPAEYTSGPFRLRVNLGGLQPTKIEGNTLVYIGKKDIRLSDGSFRLQSSVFQVSGGPYGRNWSNQGGWNYYVDIVPNGLQAVIDHCHHKVYKSPVLQGEKLREGGTVTLATDAWKSGHPTIATLRLRAI